MSKFRVKTNSINAEEFVIEAGSFAEAELKVRDILPEVMADISGVRILSIALVSTEKGDWA